MSAGGSTSHIIQSLLVNLAIAVSKGVAAVYTGSGAMLAEAIHSGADCGNQLLLLLGVRRARRGPDALHPLGYGRALYFWSFIVALLLFTAGGVFSIYEGLHKIGEPEPIENVGIGLAILGFSLALEGYSTLSNILEINRRRKARGFFQYLHETKDSDLVVVFGENAAATLGLLFAIIAVAIAHTTGDSRWDGAGSVAIGLILIGVALFLAVEVKSLLIGESADAEIARSALEVLAESPKMTEILNIITIQQGPGEVLVALKIALDEGLTTREVVDTLNQFERALKMRCPEVRWSFVEPDFPKKKT